MLVWSKDQLDIFDFIENGAGNLQISAVAGSGKTTVIAEACNRLQEDASAIFVAFNNHIVKSLRSRINPNFEVSTLHSFGWRMIRNHYRGCDVFLAESKIYDLVKTRISAWKITAKQEKSYTYKIVQLVNLIRMTLSETDEEILELAAKHDFTIQKDEIEHCRQIIGLSNKDEKNFDFVDMIYQPATNKNIRVSTYGYVFVDESQDLSKSQQELVLRMKHRKGRLITVGDPYQAIYGFAGADVESFNNFAKIPNTTRLPLSTCYRCARGIVRLAKNIVPHIRSHKGNEQGVIRNGLSKEIRNGDWVLCRNTKPLVKLCISLIKRGKKANIKGKDYGRELVGLLRSTKTDNTDIASVRLESEIEKLYNKLRRYGIMDPDSTATMIDLREKIDILNELVLDEVFSVKAGIKFIESIFTDEVSEITLSTIHKAKGFENDRIFVLRKDLIPSRYAIEDWQLAQEKNLEYVMITRAKKELIYITDIEK